MKRLLPALLLVLCSCAALTLAEKESPACVGLDSSILTKDGELIAQLAVDLPAGEMALALKAFIDAKGVQQFTCAEQIAEALLGHPVAPLDAGTQPADAGSPLANALMMKPAAVQAGALEKLQTFKAGKGIK